MKTTNIMLDTLERKRDVKREKKKRQKAKKADTNEPERVITEGE